MISQASCSDRAMPCLPIARQGQPPAPACRMPTWGPGASCSRTRRQCSMPNAICNNARAPIMPGRCLALRRCPVPTRDALGLRRCGRVPSLGDIMRSLRALHRTAGAAAVAPCPFHGCWPWRGHRTLHHPPALPKRSEAAPLTRATSRLS
jgi:hypothetical protein